MADEKRRYREIDWREHQEFDRIAEQVPPAELRRIGRLLMPQPEALPIIAETFGPNSYLAQAIEDLYTDGEEYASNQLHRFKFILDAMAPYCYRDEIGLFQDPPEHPFPPVTDEELGLT